MPDDRRQHDGEQGPATPNPANISGERLAALAPVLRELLTDFRKLEQLVRPGTEPAMTPDLEGYTDER